jgi:AcrR family transcriptional regulator
VHNVIDTALLDAADRVLQRDGLRGLTLSSLAAEAQISRVTLHRRGTTIDDVIVAVLTRASDDLRTSLWPAVTGPGDAATRLVHGLEVLCDVAERHAAVLIAFFAVPARPIPDRPDRTTSFEFIELFERLLRDGEVDGTLDVDDARADATLLANTVCWSYLHMRHAHRWSARRARDRVVALAMAGHRRTAP